MGGGPGTRTHSPCSLSLSNWRVGLRSKLREQMRPNGFIPSRTIQKLRQIGSVPRASSDRERAREGRSVGARGRGARGLLRLLGLSEESE